MTPDLLDDLFDVRQGALAIEMDTDDVHSELGQVKRRCFSETARRAQDERPLTFYDSTVP